MKFRCELCLVRDTVQKDHLAISKGVGGYITQPTTDIQDRIGQQWF